VGDAKAQRVAGQAAAGKVGDEVGLVWLSVLQVGLGEDRSRATDMDGAQQGRLVAAWAGAAERRKRCIVHV
jgi:hypothetical protein